MWSSCEALAEIGRTIICQIVMRMVFGFHGSI
jgi:hypothetical protein